MSWKPQIAVIVPCLNEQAAIGKVVRDFRTALPEAVVFVYDNGSTDRTSEVAREAGAIVRKEPLKGKGNVMRRMFADVEADIYVLVDGDDTYDAASAPALIERLQVENLDMVNGSREEKSEQAYRAGHRFGNRLLTGLVALFFGERFNDMLSGYRIMSRRFVKSFPALSSGFEIETELTVHALQLRLPIAEVMTPYRERPPASSSKLRTIPDGIRIMRLIIRLIREERPLEFFSTIAALLAGASILLAIPLLLEFLETGLVPRIPTAVLSTGMMLLSFLCLTCGLILATVTRGRIEAKRLQYLTIPIRLSHTQVVHARPLVPLAGVRVPASDSPALSRQT
jgi:glycosyltransferase involved in cell wall biosynthesis